MSSVASIRQTFLNYFKSNNHKIVKSSNLIPEKDPTLLFVNSGMVQFKNVFTGHEKRDYLRAASSQKCIRAGGKHNDLENVGHTARHHTFFEMLGNFSFGDYFKDFAIEHSWNLLTKEFALPPEKLLVTVFHEDDEAKNLWKKISGLHDKKIISINTSDNFWSMGDTGPCGPCSEIFFDHGSHIDGGPPGSKNEEGDRFIEIWNLVFMQFEQIDLEKRIELPKPSIDTGMGLERIAAVLQGKHDNYEIDLMEGIINESSKLTNSDPYGKFKTSHRIIADHLRSSSFLIADGVLPSNEGRGYVLRRIMRRAMRHAHIMGCKDPLLCEIFPKLIDEMGKAFPELIESESLIYKTLKQEELKFKETLDNGLAILSNETLNLQRGDTLDGKVAFKLYDTYGFPLDLTEDILKDRGIDIDFKGFQNQMNVQKKIARASWKGSGDKKADEFWLNISNLIPSTNFMGYLNLELEGEVLGIILNSSQVGEVSDQNECEVIFNQTPFYAKSGGQESDRGIIKASNFEAIVKDCWKTDSGIFVHHIYVKKGTIKLGDKIKMLVDKEERNKLSVNHTSTHILHQVLRDELGTHVSQKGSLVASDRLRFDFSHSGPIAENQLIHIEEMVNDKIRENSLVKIRDLKLVDAKKEGALALFGEKYKDEVRVVSIGSEINKSKSRSYWSIELCGGTHVKRTGDIGTLKISSETAVSSGVRRIEALTGKIALDSINDKSRSLNEISEILKTKPDLIVDKIKSILNEKKKIEKDLTNLKQKSIASSENNMNFKKIGNISFIGKILDDVPPQELKGYAENLLKDVESGIATILSKIDNKVSIVTSVTKNITDKYNAIEIVKIGSEKIGGKGGGGRPDMAQSGGTQPNNSEAAINEIINYIESI